MEPDTAQERVWIDRQTPTAYRALVHLATAVRAAGADAGLDRRLLELINVRISQINGCASCLDLHHRAALTAGASAQELAMLPSWRRGDFFGPAERAALGLAEATATLADEASIDREYAGARRQFSEDQLAVIIWAATTISAFNRVSILSRHPVRERRDGA
ncbi:carboxymuconolactone decarboxylase family protein [Nocardia cyriacigeorgica]|uniref:Argininosuccinate synthase n=1 Tax=Nocardia cyriacigeorgica TaxID=135487 RepID=A0A4U8W4K6_9NOCA|nr:carboxymuconolactone decarboxylase family protein [Nocardia cyriacigeorgica]VFA99879.1 Argininosuccinate synthase [Nocardia cyriacigeorgica]